MQNLTVLNLAIGLFFLYFLFSVIASAVVEGLAQMRDLRSRHLRQWVKDTLGDTLGDALLQHGLIKGLTQTSRKADYIPAKVFASALLDLVYTKYRASMPEQDGAYVAYDFYRLEAALLDTGNPLPEDLKRYLIQALEESKSLGGQLELIKKRLEAWYEDAMNRVGGTYKKTARYTTWIVAIVVTLAANADTIALSRYLEHNPNVTSQLVDAATQAVRDSLLIQQATFNLDKLVTENYDSSAVKRDSVLRAEIKNTFAALRVKKALSDSLYAVAYNMGLPLGWDHAVPTYQPATGACGCHKFWFYTKWAMLKFVGLMLTALALTLGAPFWFDMINKLVNIRSSGNKPEDEAAKKARVLPT